MTMIKSDKSLLRLSTAAMFAGLLVLAACGGSGPQPTPPAPTPTPEEQCSADGGIYEDGECKSADDLREEGAQQEGEDRDAAEAKAARMAAAEKFHGLLFATDPADIAQPVNLRIAAYSGQIGDAEDGVFDRGTIEVRFRDTMGPATMSENHDGTNRDADSAALNANPNHVMASGFATGQNELKTHEGGDELAGSYKGAMGTYTCAAAATDCTSRRTAKGIQLGGASWSFVPNANSMYSIPDDNYAEYGWWLDETATLATARVGAWYAADGGTEIVDLSVANSSGTASYMGSAIGVAAYYHGLEDDGNVGGGFTADAELNANFDSNSLSGSITNFDIGGYNPDWSVMLGGSPTMDAGTSAVTGGTTTWDRRRGCRGCTQRSCRRRMDGEVLRHS